MSSVVSVAVMATLPSLTEVHVHTHTHTHTHTHVCAQVRVSQS